MPSARPPALFQGFLGKHPIRAALVRDKDWVRGTYRFVGKVERSIEGAVHVELGAPRGESGLPYGDCQFTERNARGFVTATLDGYCEDGGGFVFRGTRTDTSGGTEEMFLCDVLGDERGFERYERALLRTAGPEHGCPPLLQVDQVIARSGAPTWVLYRLGWVCENKWPSSETGLYLPLDDKLYRATFDEADPTRFLDVGIFANEISPEEGVKLDFVPWGSSLTVLRLELERSWPHESRERRTFWLTDGSGRTGPALSLPSSSRFGCCQCVQNEDRVELFRVPLDGGVADDLLVRTTEKKMTLGGPINGESTCPALPDKVEYFAYRLDVARLRFAPVSTPAQGRVAELLRRAERLD